jgi:hypothetical protein
MVVHLQIELFFIDNVEDMYVCVCVCVCVCMRERERAIKEQKNEGGRMREKTK